MNNTQFYLGEIIDVLRNDDGKNYSYSIKFTVRGFIDEALAYPFRDTSDEPVIGEKVLVYNLDSIFGSAYLYAKLKEDDFIGIRSNGKMISVTDESIDIFCHTGRDGQDGNHIVGLHLNDDGTMTLNNNKSYIDINEDGLVLRTEGSDQEIIVDSSSNISIITKGNIDIKSEGNITIDSEGTTTIKSENIVVSPGSTLTTSGNPTVSPTGTGPFCAIKVCPYSGMPHVGNVIKF